MGIFNDTINLLLNRSENVQKADKPIVSDFGASNMGSFPINNGTTKKPRATVDFKTLRSFSVIYDVARACINHRKREIYNLDWGIVPKDNNGDDGKHSKQIESITSFFEYPAHATDFKAFVDKIIEDLLVLDAVVIWKDVTFGGEVKELVNVDGSTIRLRVGEDGMLPEPPDAAYQQVIDGKVVAEYDTEQIVYKMMNPRTNTPYGLGPLESLIIGVDAALRSQMLNASLLAEGTVPEGFYSLPDDWDADQIKSFQNYFDALLAGNLSQNPRIKFMPGGRGVGYTPTKKSEDMKFLELEKWLLMKTCALFDVQPQDIGFTENINLNSGDTQAGISNQRGLIPTAKFLQQIFNEVILRDFGIRDLKFEWKGIQAVDEEFELKRSESMLKNGAMTIDEIRNKQGEKPFGLPGTTRPFILTSSGPIYLDKEEEQEEKNEQVENDDDLAIEEMQKWENKCINYLKKGKQMPEFKCNHIDKAASALINARLTGVVNKEDVREVFKPFKKILSEYSIARKAMMLKNESARARMEYERVE